MKWDREAVFVGIALTLTWAVIAIIVIAGVVFAVAAVAAAARYGWELAA